MKNNVIASLIIGFCLLFIMQIAFAEDSSKPTNLMKMSTAIQKLHAKGYKNIREIEFKDGFYKAKVFTPEGYKIEVRVNTKTGGVEKIKDTPKMVGILEVIKKVQAAGYRDIFRINFDDDEYEVFAVNKDGKNVNLEVDATTGEIEKDWF